MASVTTAHTGGRMHVSRRHRRHRKPCFEQRQSSTARWSLVLQHCSVCPSEPNGESGTVAQTVRVISGVTWENSPKMHATAHALIAKGRSAQPYIFTYYRNNQDTANARGGQGLSTVDFETTRSVILRDPAVTSNILAGHCSLHREMQINRIKSKAWR